MTGSFTDVHVKWKGEQLDTCVKNYKELVQEGKMTIGGLQTLIIVWRSYPGWNAIVEKYDLN